MRDEIIIFKMLAQSLCVSVCEYHYFHSILCTHLPFFTSDIPSVYEPEI